MTIPVSQEDRRRLAERYRQLLQPGMAEEVERGEHDNHPNLEMLAAHRLRAIEEAAKAIAHASMRLFTPNTPEEAAYVQGRDDALAAIRKLSQ